VGERKKKPLRLMESQYDDHDELARDLGTPHYTVITTKDIRNHLREVVEHVLSNPDEPHILVDARENRERLVLLPYERAVELMQHEDEIGEDEVSHRLAWGDL
jgi:hypothetical protein